MKLRKCSALTLGMCIAVFSVTNSAQADINVGLTTQIGVMKSADGSRALGDGTFAFYADTAGDGLGDLTNPTSFSTDQEDDLFLGKTDIPLFFDTPGFLSGTFVFDVPENSVIRGVFYDTQSFDERTSGPGAGVDFGIVPTATEPNGPGNFPFSYTTTEVFGDNEPSTLFATNGTTVPEPGTATAMIAALGGLVMMSRRRRSA